MCLSGGYTEAAGLIRSTQKSGGRDINIIETSCQLLLLHFYHLASSSALQPSLLGDSLLIRSSSCNVALQLPWAPSNQMEVAIGVVRLLHAKLPLGLFRSLPHPHINFVSQVLSLRMVDHLHISSFRKSILSSAALPLPEPSAGRSPRMLD
jgi:hypothetical protein